jgi:hypothetical protein
MKNPFTLDSKSVILLLDGIARCCRAQAVRALDRAVSDGPRDWMDAIGGDSSSHPTALYVWPL